MAECDNTVALQRPDLRFGVPNPTFIKPIVMVNKQVQEAPVGWKLDACYLPANVPLATTAAGSVTFTDPLTGNSITVNQTTNRLISVIAGVTESFVLTPA